MRVRNLASTVRRGWRDRSPRTGRRVWRDTGVAGNVGRSARFDSATYRTANWIVVGETTGGGRRELGAPPRVAGAEASV